MLLHYLLPCQFSQEVLFGRLCWFILVPIYKISFTICKLLIGHKMGTSMCIFEPIDDVTALSTQYLTSIFSEYSCTDPYYRWHELKNDSTFPCDVLRIIIQVFNTNWCYSIIQPMSKVLMPVIQFTEMIQKFCYKTIYLLHFYLTIKQSSTFGNILNY